MPSKKTESELREEDDRVLAEQAKLVDEALDRHFTLGGDPAAEEEREYLADKAEERRLNDETPVTRAEIRRIQAELQKNAELATKALKASSGSFEGMLADEKQDRRRRARYALYDSIRRSGGTVRIQLHTSDGPGGTENVPVSINGRRWSLPRGIAVEVPVEVLAVLDDAQVRHYRPEILPDGTTRQVAYDFLRYPYVRLDGPMLPEG